MDTFFKVNLIETYRKVFPMSERPTTFTEEEQLKLQELESQGQGFANFKAAITRSLHSGQDSVIIANLLQFLHNMTQQSAQQIEEVQKAAKARTAKDETKESKKKAN